MAFSVVSSLSSALSVAEALSSWALPCAIWSRASSFWLAIAASPSASCAFPLARLARPSFSSCCASHRPLSTLFSTRAFSASIFSCESVTVTCSLTRPVSSTLATPSSRSNAGTTVSSVNAEICLTSMPSISTLATITGSISGLIFSSMGVPTISSSWPETRSMLPDSSIMAESIFVPCSNSRMMTLAFSLEIELTFLMPPVVPSTDSSGRVTVASIFSGLAPG